MTRRPLAPSAVLAPAILLALPSACATAPTDEPPPGVATTPPRRPEPFPPAFE